MAQNQEAKEVGLLIGEPALKITITAQRRSRWWRKPVTLSETYEIYHPTLAVLDLLSSCWLNIDIPKEISSITEVNGLMSHAADMAKVVAIMCLNEKCFSLKRNGTYEVREKEIRNLANIIAHGMQPAQLIEVARAVTSLCDMPNFINSMRLMCASRTTQARSGIE